jgi:hypothetical protein
MPRAERGAKAREEMHAKGFLQVRELAEKLTAETGKKGLFTLAMLLIIFAPIIGWPEARRVEKVNQ